MAPTRLDWKREEVILAMDVYVMAGALGGGPLPDKKSEAVKSLSATLRALSAYPLAMQYDTYRNVNGVGTKMANLRYVETDGAHGLRGASQMDRATWRDFIDDLPLLHQEAEAIRAGVVTQTLVPASSSSTRREVPVEVRYTERYIVKPSANLRVAERAEQRLVESFCKWMAARSYTVTRHEYRPSQEVRPIYSDAWVGALNLLIEAKNSDSRDHVRHAIGQLFDYRRFHEAEPNLAILLPYRPSADMADLLSSCGIHSVWPHGGGFRASAKGLLG